MSSGLATLVAGIWTEAGYDTTISHRDGETYVLAEHASGSYDLLWVLDPGAELTVEGVERYRSRIANLDLADAYAVTSTEVGGEAERFAERHGVHPVGVGTLRSLAAESGVGQDAVDAALATTVAPESEATDDESDSRAARDETGADDGGVALDDPDQQATIRQRMAVMIGEAEPDADPEAEAVAESEAESTAQGTDDADQGSDDENGTTAATEDEDGGEPGDDAPDPLASDDPDDREDTAASGAGESAAGADAAAGSDPLGGPELPGDPDASGGGGGTGGGPLRSRRGLITGGAAAVLTAGVLDFAVFNVVFGGGDGGFPAYDETRVKTEAARYTPEAIMADPTGFADQEVAVVFEGALVTDVTDDGGLAAVTFDAGGTVVGRWDGDAPTIGTRYTIWGVVTGTTTVAEEDVPTVDIVDMTAGDGGTRGGATTGTASGTTESGG